MTGFLAFLLTAATVSCFFPNIAAIIYLTVFFFGFFCFFFFTGKGVASTLSFLFFALLFSLEIILLLAFLPFIMRSSFFAFSLAGVFLTFFSFFILKIYFQAKKSEQEELFVESYGRGCRSLIGFREGIPEHHIALAQMHIQDWQVSSMDMSIR